MNMRSKKLLYQNVHYSLIILLAVSIPLSTKLNSLVVILILFNWIIEFNFKERFRVLWQDKTIVFLISYYLLCVVGLIYSNNLEVGYGILIKRITLLIFPIIFANYYYHSKIINLISYSFILTIIAIITYTLVSVYLGHKMHVSEYTSDKLRDVLIQPTKLHAPYFALYVLFALCLLNYQLLNNDSFKKPILKYIGVIVSLYLIGFIILLASRMALIALVIIVVFVSTFIFIKRKLYFLFISGFLLVLFIGYLIISSTVFSQRFYEVVDTKWEPPIGIHHNSTNLRIGIFNCTYEIFKKNWLIGTGTGDMQDQLNACYKANGYSNVMYLDNYNTHSVYLDAIIMLGVVGLFILLCNFAFYLRLAVQHQAWLYLCFLFIFLFCGISESFLNTQKGIIFFSFFNTLLFYCSKRETVSRLL